MGERCESCNNDSSNARRKVSAEISPTKNNNITATTNRPASNLITLDNSRTTDNDLLEKTGYPLDTATKSQMESHFGHNFDHVRIHTDGGAQRSAQSVDASLHNRKSYRIQQWTLCTVFYCRQKTIGR